MQRRPLQRQRLQRDGKRPGSVGGNGRARRWRRKKIQQIDLAIRLHQNRRVQARQSDFPDPRPVRLKCEVDPVDGQRVQFGQADAVDRVQRGQIGHGNIPDEAGLRRGRGRRVMGLAPRLNLAGGDPHVDLVREIGLKWSQFQPGQIHREVRGDRRQGGCSSN